MLRPATNSIKRATLITMLFCVAVFGEEFEKINVASTDPQPGVFVSYGWQSTVIELKNGKFRYWFASDTQKEEALEYPLEGNYVISKNKITLENLQGDQNEWFFREVEGVITLWRQEAINMHKAGTLLSGHIPGGLALFKKRGEGLVLVKKDQSAEDAWSNKKFASKEFEVLATVTSVSPPNKENPERIEVQFLVNHPPNLMGIGFCILTRSKDWSKIHARYPLGRTYNVRLPSSFEEEIKKWHSYKTSLNKQAEGDNFTKEVPIAWTRPKIDFLNLGAPPSTFKY